MCIVTALLNISLNANPGIQSEIIEEKGDNNATLKRSMIITDSGGNGEGKSRGEIAQERINPMKTCIQKNSRKICIVLRQINETMDRRIPSNR
jgi:hypothetical protein